MLKQKNSGFSLIELCIVMVIVGLFMAGAAAAYSVYVQKMAVTKTKDNIDEVSSAIAAFRSENGYYPCPANGTDPAAVATNCATSVSGAGIVSVNTGVAGQKVRIGVVPMSVTDKNGDIVQLVSTDKRLDGYRNRLTYAVIETMAIDEATFPAGSPGSIKIRNFNDAAAPLVNTRYVVLSHGPDGTGAYTVTGALRAPCKSAAVDGENCNGDAVFADNVDGPRSFTGDNNNYDDFITSQTNGGPRHCPADQGVVSIDFANQTVTCAPLDKPGIGNCPAGQKITSVNFGNRTVTCGAEPTRGGVGTCPAGQQIGQVDFTNGTVTCVTPPTNSGVLMGMVSITHAGGHGTNSAVCSNAWGDISCGCVMSGGGMKCTISCLTSTPKLLSSFSSAQYTGSNEPPQPFIKLYGCVGNSSGAGSSTSYTKSGNPREMR